MAVALAETGDVPSAPTAGWAGEALARGGVCEVWLFGSAARGAPAEASAINHVAVHEGLDYARRWAANKGWLNWASSRRAGRSIDVMVTDLPEREAHTFRRPAY